MTSREQIAQAFDIPGEFLTTHWTISDQGIALSVGTHDSDAAWDLGYDVDKTRYCSECDVTWTGGLHCWSCGEEGEPSRPPFIKDQELAPYGGMAED